MTRPRFNRILLKLSGEALMGPGQFGIDPEAVAGLAGEIAAAKDTGMSCAWSSAAATSSAAWPRAAKGIDRASADYMGMLATVMNALAMQNALEKLGVDTRVQSAIPMASVSRAVHPPPRAAPSREGPHRAVRRGHRQSLSSPPIPRAALRAAEMGCDALFKGTSVDGVYTADPKKVARRQALRHARASTRCSATTSR